MQPPLQGALLLGPPQPQASYGGVPGQAKPPLKRRRRTNYLALAFSLLLPWVVFTVTFGVMSFSVRYQHPQLCGFVVALGAVFVVLCGGMAYKSLRRKTPGGEAGREPTWYAFIAATLLVGWTLALIFGNANFSSNMHPYYDVTNLNTYPGVDPSRTHGQQLLDAGRVVFTRSSALDLSKSFGFRNVDTYCVAPITASSERLASYDFWAVGVNCCSGNKPDFHCPGFDNPRIHAGLRLMDNSQREYFKLAVEQAEAAYRIRAASPIFFHWTEDPIGEMNRYQDSGFKYYLLGVMSFFALQLFLVVVFSSGLSQLGAR